MSVGEVSLDLVTSSLNGQLYYPPPHDIDRPLNEDDLTVSTVSLFFASSGVQFDQSNQFHYRRETFYSQIKSKVGNILSKSVSLCINLNIDGTPIVFTLSNLSPLLLVLILRSPFPPVNPMGISDRKD
jgi:hypothetical protein